MTQDGVSHAALSSQARERCRALPRQPVPVVEHHPGTSWPSSWKRSPSTRRATVAYVQYYVLSNDFYYRGLGLLIVIMYITSFETTNVHLSVLQISQPSVNASVETEAHIVYLRCNTKQNLQIFQRSHSVYPT
jgi:predicted nuclease with RNAse H fold